MLVLGLATLAGSAAAMSLNHQLDQALANRLTIHLSDLPTGWQVEPVSKSSGPSCKAIKSVESIETARAETRFSNLPDLAFSRVGALPTVAISKHTYTDFVNNARPCLLTIPNLKSASVEAMPIPRFGDQSKAWSVHVSHRGVDVYLDFILVRIQRADAEYLFAGIGSGDSYQEANLVRKATARA
jgi:hypothetical protein